MSKKMHLDTAESAFFERELLSVKNQTYDVKYPALMARRLVPVSNEAGAGAMEVGYQSFDRVGRAKIGAPGATDAPRVDVFGTEFLRPVRVVTDSYGYHLLEVRSAAMAGRPLNARRASVARRAIEEVLDEVAAVGSPDNGIATGFLNDANVTIDAAAGVWSAATAAAMINDIRDMVVGVATDTLGVEKPDILLLPEAQYAIATTMERTTTSDVTVAQYILQNFPQIKAIEPWYRLEGAGAGGVDRGVLYRRSPDVLQQEIPSEFEQLPVFQRGQNFDIECMATTAGTAIYYPGSVRYLDGI